jgi:hypothetical protein
MTDGSGRWRVNGAAAPALDGCLDLDLESSAMTNALPVHRLQLEVGEHAEAPAAYVRAVDLTVERLEQRYVRLDDDGGRQRYRYSAPRFRFECELVYDEHGLVLDYPASPCAPADATGDLYPFARRGATPEQRHSGANLARVPRSGFFSRPRNAARSAPAVRT